MAIFWYLCYISGAIFRFLFGKVGEKVKYQCRTFSVSVLHLSVLFRHSFLQPSLLFAMNDTLFFANVIEAVQAINVGIKQQV